MGQYYEAALSVHIHTSIPVVWQDLRCQDIKPTTQVAHYQSPSRHVHTNNPSRVTMATTSVSPASRLSEDGVTFEQVRSGQGVEVTSCWGNSAQGQYAAFLPLVMGVQIRMAARRLPANIGIIAEWWALPGHQYRPPSRRGPPESPSGRSVGA